MMDLTEIKKNEKSVLATFQKEIPSIHFSDKSIKEYNNITGRHIMQTIGTDIMRNHIDSFYWVKSFEKELIKLEPAGALFYDIPLLFEKKLQDQFDITICIFSKPETQLDRLINRDGISEDGAQKILKAQMPIDEKADLADFVIDNNNDKSSLFNNIKNLIQEISA